MWHSAQWGDCLIREIHKTCDEANRRTEKLFDSYDWVHEKRRADHAKLLCQEVEIDLVGDKRSFGERPDHHSAQQRKDFMRNFRPSR